MPPVEKPSNLASLQRDLVLALTSQGQPPIGFDLDRLEVAAAALARKRMNAVARAWPILAQTLSASFAGMFSKYAAITPLPQTT